MSSLICRGAEIPCKKYHIEVEETNIPPSKKNTRCPREHAGFKYFAQKTFTHNLFETDEGKQLVINILRTRVTDAT
jgi:hypothetical protein